MALMLSVISSVTFFTGCSGSSYSTLEKEPLFSLPIGKMEDQLDVYYDGGLLLH